VKTGDTGQQHGCKRGVDSGDSRDANTMFGGLGIQPPPHWKRLDAT
jgi:hypothetical protein